jgi:two-component system osmolarity sensor histidine kinase EnvZ
MLLKLIKNNILPRSLYGRSLLIIIMPLILLQIVSAWIFYDRHWDTITKRLSISLVGDISQVMELLGKNPSDELKKTVFDMALRNFSLQMEWRSGERLPEEIARSGSRIDYFLGSSLRTQFQGPVRIDDASG